MHIREIAHQIGLETAIFFGKPGWTRHEAAELGLSDKEQDIKEAEAHLNAVEREEIIWGNLDGKRFFHLKRAHELLGVSHLYLPIPGYSLIGIDSRNLPQGLRLILHELMYGDF